MEENKMRSAFRMKLRPGCAEEYRKRHAAIWPELLRSLRATGISDYTIWLDPGTETLFAQRQIESPQRLSSLPDDPVFRRWQEFIEDLLEQEPDGSGPAVSILQEIFHME